VKGSDPPRCAAHSASVGTSKGKHNGEQRGSGIGLRTVEGRPLRDLTQIDEVVADLAERQAQLTDYLTTRLIQGADVQEVAKLFALHGQNASRLGRLLRDRRALSGESADGLLQAVGQALDEISTELGIEL
jgi:hypothetical protein